MSDGNLKPGREEIDPAMVERLLQVELMRSRAEWNQTKARHASFRMMSFFFLFLVIVAALLAFFFLYSSGRLSELKAEGEKARTTASPSVAPVP